MAVFRVLRLTSALLRMILNNSLPNLPVIPVSRAYLGLLAVILSLLATVSVAPALAGQPAESEVNARELLDAMTTASRNLNYVGTFIYQRGDQTDAMEIIHKSDNDGEQERLVSLTGITREVVRNNEFVTCIFPDKQHIRIDKSRPHRRLVSTQISQPIDKLAESYDFRIAGQDRVAGRDAWIVNVLPRDQYRYGYQLWIDAKSKLLLKSELKDENGRLQELVMFTELEILDDIADGRLAPTLQGIDITWQEQGTGAAIMTSTTAGQADKPDDFANGELWQVDWMPQGFRLSEHTYEQLGDSPRSLQHLVFTDGLSMVSVFVEKLADEDNIMIGPSNVGAVNAFARQAEGHQVMVVGEVPQMTVRLMASSVVRQP